MQGVLEFVISHSSWRHQERPTLVRKHKLTVPWKELLWWPIKFSGVNPSQIAVSLPFQDAQSIQSFYLSVPQMGRCLWTHEMAEWCLWEQWCRLVLGQELGSSATSYDRFFSKSERNGQKIVSGRCSGYGQPGSHMRYCAILWEPHQGVFVTEWHGQCSLVSLLRLSASRRCLSISSISISCVMSLPCQCPSSVATSPPTLLTISCYSDSFSKNPSSRGPGSPKVCPVFIDVGCYREI